MSSIFTELKRRNVFRVAGVYAVVGWLLAQIATTLEETLGLPAWFDSLIVALLLIGLPIALIFAWAFEMTPEGVIRTEAVPEGASITAETGRKLDVAIIVGLVLLGAMIIWQRLSPGLEEAREVAPVAELAEPVDAASIAVLPFADLSPLGDQEYFSDGIAEEILNVLVGVDGLDVTSRTSSFQFKKADLGIPEIAAQLKVRHVLEGSVRKSGETIRVTAQLIDAANDKHLWSDTYDRPLTAENIFEIQDDISNSIVDALGDALGIESLEHVEVEATTRNLTAYELFLKARPLFLARVDLDVADRLLERAIELDPEYAKAWEIRAALQGLMVSYNYSDAPAEQANSRGLEFASQALSIEPRSATALAVIARGQTITSPGDLRKTNYRQVLADFAKALDIEPQNSSTLLWRGIVFMEIGFLETALDDFSLCMKYEPYYTPCLENHFFTLMMMGRDMESLQSYRGALGAGAVNIRYAPLPVLARLDEELAFKSATNSPRLLKGWRRHDDLYRAYKHPREDHSELIQSIREYLESTDRFSYGDFLYITTPIGGHQGSPYWSPIWDASLKHYRESNEFKMYVREAGIYDYWLTEGFPPQCRPIGNDDFECD